MSTASTSPAGTRRYGLGRLSRLHAQTMETLRNWGTNETDRELSFECDRYVQKPHSEYYRGIDIQAPAPVVFRWLCQLRVAPYSHDWIDNFGRRSPRELIPGLERLAAGQRMLSIFELVEFEPDSKLTMRICRRRLLCGDVACSYRLEPYDSHSCKLLAKVTTHHSSGLLGTSRRMTLRWGELIMMQTQFRNFKQLAEATAREGWERSAVAGAPAQDAVAGAPR
jgi:hypothetical protein